MSEKYIDLTLTDGQNDFNIEQVVIKNQNVVLLGVPGSGKSILLQHFYETHKNECELVSVKEFVKMPVCIKDTTKYFLIDGLDELRSASKEKEAVIYDIVIKINELKKIKKDCCTLISCREMDWYGDNDDAALSKHLPFPVVKVYVAPLSECQKRLFVDVYLNDASKAGDFRLRILNNREYGEILNVPQTLVMLLRIFNDYPNDVPTRKIELYEKIVKLSLEQKKSILRENEFNLSEDEVFKYAGYIAYFYMMSDLDEIEEGSLLRISESQDYIIEKLKSVIELNLFEKKDHIIFSHRTIAEYLCAHFLYNQKMKKDRCSEDEVMTWLISKNGKIPSEIRGVYAWFCSMTESEKCFSVDPYGQFLYGDNSLFKVKSKEKVIASIEKYADNVKPYFLHIGDPYRQEGFYEPEMDSFLIEKYRAGLEKKNNFLIFLGLVMTSAAVPTSVILDFSKEIVAKRDLEFHFKVMFIDYLKTDVVYLQNILKEIVDEKMDDPDDEFLDAILSILYPEVISPSEIIVYLKKYKKHDCFRNQFSFLSEKTISQDDLSVLVDGFYSDENLELGDKRDLLSSVETVVGNYLLILLIKQPPEVFLKKLCMLAQKNLTLTNGAWYSKIKDFQNVDEKIKEQLYLNYLINTTVNNVNEKNDVYYARKYYLQSFVSTILPCNHIDILTEILKADKTNDFKLEILFEMYRSLRSNAETSDDAERFVSEIASRYGILDRFKKGITYTPSPEIAEMMKKNDEETSERKRKIKETVDANRVALRTMSQEKKENLWRLLIDCAEFYLISSETEVELRLGLCLENYHEMLQILKGKLFQDPKKRVYYEYTNIRSLVNGAPSAGRNVDNLYYAILCLNGPNDYEKINDEEFLKYLYLVSVHESHVANSEKAEFLNWFEEKRINDAVGIIQDFILIFFEESVDVLKNLRAFYLKMTSEYRGNERTKYLGNLKSVIFFTETGLSKQEEIADKLMHVFDFQLDVNLLNSFALTGNLAAKRDSLVKFINRDSSIDKNDAGKLIEIIGFRWHSFSLNSIINDYQYIFIKSMILFFDTRESMAFHSGVQSNIDGAAFYVNNVMLKQINGVEGKIFLYKLLGDCESELWKPMLKTRIEEIDEILTDNLKTKMSLSLAKKNALEKRCVKKSCLSSYICNPLYVLGTYFILLVVFSVVFYFTRNEGIGYLDCIRYSVLSITTIGFDDVSNGKNVVWVFGAFVEGIANVVLGILLSISIGVYIKHKASM